MNYTHFFWFTDFPPVIATSNITSFASGEDAIQHLNLKCYFLRCTLFQVSLVHSSNSSHHSLTNYYLLTDHSGKRFIFATTTAVVTRIRYNSLASKVNVSKGDLVGKTPVQGCKTYEGQRSRCTTVSVNQQLFHRGKEMWGSKTIC